MIYGGRGMRTTFHLVAALSRSVGTRHRGVVGGVPSAGHPARRRHAEPGVAMRRDEIFRALTALGAELAERGLDSGQDP
jgi:hypothetical protein